MRDRRWCGVSSEVWHQALMIQGEGDGREDGVVAPPSLSPQPPPPHAQPGLTRPSITRRPEGAPPAAPPLSDGDDMTLVAAPKPLHDRHSHVATPGELGERREQQPEPELTGAGAAAAEVATAARQRYFCVVPTAPGQKQCQLLSSLLQERGWKEWGVEDWFISQADEMLQRPKDQKHCDFCNCGSYSDIIVDVPGTEHAYDRLLLADLCPDLCPPSYKIKNGGLIDCPDGISEMWRGERPCNWFLKENSRNYGQGIDVCRTAQEALEIAARNEEEKPGAGREYVLQPHVVKPLLYDRDGVGYKFHVRVYCCIIVSPKLRYPRNLAHANGKLAISSEPWHPDVLNKKAQITTARSPDAYMDWQHYNTVHPILLAQTSMLLERLEGKLGPQPWSGRAAFEMLGLDFMVSVEETADGGKHFEGWLLEANTGPVLKRESDMDLMMGLCQMIFGPRDAQLEGYDAGSGAAGHGWMELNNQRCSPQRRRPRIGKLIGWMRDRATDPDCELCLEEELLAYVAAELLEFAAAVGAGGPRMLHEAGLLEAVLSVLTDEELNSEAYVHVLGLLSKMCTDADVTTELATSELIELLVSHVDIEMEELAQPLQLAALNALTPIATACSQPLAAETLGVLVGTVLWLLESPSEALCDSAACCIAGLCLAQCDGVSYATTLVQLGGGSRLQHIDAVTGGRLNGLKVAMSSLETMVPNWRELEGTTSARSLREEHRANVERASKQQYPEHESSLESQA